MLLVKLLLLLFVVDVVEDVVLVWFVLVVRRCGGGNGAKVWPRAKIGSGFIPANLVRVAALALVPPISRKSLLRACLTRSFSTD